MAGEAAALGWTLVSGNDLVRDLPAELTTLMDQVARSIATPSWTTLPLASGNVANANSGDVGSLRATKLGGMVQCEGKCGPTGGGTYGSGTITLVAAGGIPTALRPGNRWDFAMGASNLPVHAWVDTDGSIKCNQASGQPWVDLANLRWIPGQ